MILKYSFFIIFAATLLIWGLTAANSQTVPSCRDAKTWPFAQDSIWNVPIGSGARYVAANLKLPSNGYDPEENVIIMTPNAPQRTIMEMVSGGWDGSQQARCASMNRPLGSNYPKAPIPNDFITLNRMGGTQPNAAAAILLPDNETIIQNQPFTICSAGGEVLSKYVYETSNIKTGDGIKGAQGGTGMSSIGGAIRLNEMVPGATINHALKIVLFGIENLHFDRATGRGWRWPAYKHDSGAEPGGCNVNTNTNEYCGTNPAFKIGALLALPPSVDINSLGLQSESSKMIAKAMQNYGAYAVDNSAWSNIGIAVEFGPAGDGKAKWNSLGGFNRGDLDKIFSRVQIVDNNLPTSIGGGGTPRAPLAPPFCGAGVTPGVTTQPISPTIKPTTCPKKAQGDANCDGVVSLADYALWKQEFSGALTTKTGDFNGDGQVKLVDYQIWRVIFVGGGGTGPTATKTPGAAACVTGQNGIVKIMPLGDSLTAGDDRGGYRFKLYGSLKAGGVNVDFVGPNKSGSVADNDHAGFGGHPAGTTTGSDPSIAKQVPGIISQHSPHVVLLNAGVNDKWGGINQTKYSDADVATNVVNVAKQINTLSPTTLVVVSALTSWGTSDNGDPSRVAINNAIGAAINQMKNEGKFVLYVPESGTGLVGSDTGGDVHLTAAGYDKFADIWFRGIKPLLIDCK